MTDWHKPLPFRQPQITKEIITALAREMASKERGDTGLTYAQAMAEAMWEGAILSALDGSAAMLNTLLDRLEGKVPQVNENYNRTDVTRLSDDEIATILSRRILRRATGNGVSEKTNGEAKPY